MPNISHPLKFCVVKSIKEIPRETWDNLFGHGLIEGYGYQKTLEEGNSEGFSFAYLIGRRGDEITIIIPFFITSFSFAELFGGPLRRLVSKLKRLLRVKIIFLGSITTEEFYMGISRSENTETVFTAALEEIRSICRKDKIKVITFYNLSEKNKHLAQYLKKKGFLEMETLPSTIIKIESDSLDSYLDTLSSNMRKDLKRKLKRSSEQAQLITRMCEDITGIADDIYKLYLNNFDGSGVHFEMLTPAFFRNICRNMPGVAKFFITYEGEKIVAFNLCLVKNNFCIDKVIGFDAQVARKYHLYFTTLCHNIDWCIKNGVRFYQPGATDYHPKMRLGAKLIRLHVYAKSLNPLINSLMKPVSGFIGPKNLDASFKEIRDPENKVFKG